MGALALISFSLSVVDVSNYACRSSIFTVRDTHNFPVVHRLSYGCLPHGTKSPHLRYWNGLADTRETRAHATKTPCGSTNELLHFFTKALS